MNRLSIIIILIFLMPIVDFGQSKITKNFRNGLWEICDSVSARYVVYETNYDTSLNRGLVKTYSLDNILISETEYSDLKSKIISGYSKGYYSKGELMFFANYEHGKKEGDFKAFYRSGKIKRVDKYENNNLVSGKCFTESGLDTLYYNYEELPEYLGGEKGLRKFLSKNFKYPKEAITKGITGRVIVGFLINKEGEIIGPHIVKGVHPLLDSEALRIVGLMDKWTPGKQNGEFVDVKYLQPISFK